VTKSLPLSLRSNFGFGLFDVVETVKTLRTFENTLNVYSIMR
jgi:hypothetical protein